MQRQHAYDNIYEKESKLIQRKETCSLIFVIICTAHCLIMTFMHPTIQHQDGETSICPSQNRVRSIT